MEGSMDLSIRVFSKFPEPKLFRTYFDKCLGDILVAISRSPVNFEGSNSVSSVSQIRLINPEKLTN